MLSDSNITILFAFNAWLSYCVICHFKLCKLSFIWVELKQGWWSQVASQRWLLLNRYVWMTRSKNILVSYVILFHWRLLYCPFGKLESHCLICSHTWLSSEKCYIQCTCNQTTGMSILTGTSFQVLNHDQSDHHANYIAFITSSSSWKVSDSDVTKE